MFSRIIVATDLSAASLAVAKCAGGLKALGARRCLLLQCLSLQEAGSVSLAHDVGPLEDALARQKDILEQHGLRVEARVVPGFPKREINRIAVEENYSLIVIGSRSHSLIADPFLGGVGSAVIHDMRRPVLLVRLGVTSNGTRDCAALARCDFAEHILFPTDFSENADHAFSYVERLVADGAKRVTFLHVQDKARIEPHLKGRLNEFNEIDRDRLEVLKERLERQGHAEVDFELRYGVPFVEITRLVRERGMHLVVMGSQGRGYTKEVLLGSVSHNVARHSEAAVLLVPAERSSF